MLREIKRRTCSAEQLIACVGNVQYEHVHGWSISTKQMEALYRRDVVFKKCTVLCSTRSMCSIVNDAACAVLFAKKEPVIVCATAEGEG